MSAPALSAPPPAGGVEEGLAHIHEYGMCVIPGVLQGETLDRARTALYRAAAEDRARGREQKFGLDYDHDETNQRVWNVLNRDPVFEDMAEHPVALELVRAMLGWPALLGNISANITGPGGGEMVLHADQIFVPQPWPTEPQGFNVAWCLDDFTRENGATRMIPGSHLWHRPPGEDDQDVDTVPLEAPAGSIVAFESRVWHKTGFNGTNDERRAGVFAWYTKPIYRAQENWFLSLNPRIRQFASEEMLVLLGYKTQGLGLVYGASPN